MNLLTIAPETVPGPTTRRNRGVLVLLAVVLGPLLAAVTLWSAAALYFDVRVPWLRIPLAAAYLLIALAIWVLVPGWFRKTAISLTLFAVTLLWWLTLRPSNGRDWQPDLARLAYADIDGQEVTIHNIRNCEYRTEADFDVRYYDKTFDLSTLQSVDLYLVYWGSPSIAHSMMSFGFTGDQYVCFSIETRKEIGEGYSATKGLFRQFELIYVVADERDVVRLRTNYRKGEEAYLYQLRIRPERARALFLEYIRRVNELARAPEWYNAISDNCTTSVRAQRAGSKRAPWDWRMLANGYLDQLFYEYGLISTNLPLGEMKQLCHVNDRARDAGPSEDFSVKIRQHLPGIQQPL